MLNHANTLGFLAPGGKEFKPGRWARLAQARAASRPGLFGPAVTRAPPPAFPRNPRVLWSWRGLSGLRWVWQKGRGPHLKGRQEPQASSPFRAAREGRPRRRGLGPAAGHQGLNGGQIAGEGDHQRRDPGATPLAVVVSSFSGCAPAGLGVLYPAEERLSALPA